MLFSYVSSLLDVPLNPNLTILNLHCNHIPKIEGLTEAWQLRHLDLSSNRITQINGLGNLSSLRTLNLSCNLITKVEGKPLIPPNEHYFAWAFPLSGIICSVYDCKQHRKIHILIFWKFQTKIYPDMFFSPLKVLMCW